MNDNPLFCVSSDQAHVGWHSAGGQLVSTTNTTNHYRQERTSTGTIPSKAKLIANRPNDPLTSTTGNGLWSCRLNACFPGAVPVGIYARGGGKIIFCVHAVADFFYFQRVGFNIVTCISVYWGRVQRVWGSRHCPTAPGSSMFRSLPELPPPVNEFLHINTRKLTLIYEDGDKYVKMTIIPKSSRPNIFSNFTAIDCGLLEVYPGTHTHIMSDRINAPLAGLKICEIW